MNLKEQVQHLAQSFSLEIKTIRQHLHQHPELSFQEYETSKYIAAKLDEYQIPYKKYVKTGIVADIQGLKHSDSPRVIALRADMDALPIEESASNACKSKNAGVMHACGHDVHAASLLGVAKILKTLENEFSGTIRFIFQPGEEVCPGGARLMLEAGALADNEPELIIGQHVLPEMLAGEVGFRNGMYMASTDEVHLTIKGKGGHGAMPHQLTDTVLIASHIVVALQQVVSRNAPAAIPTVLSFGKFIANGAMNVIPSEVHISGTFRTMNESWRAEAHQRIRKIAQSTAEGMGAKCDVNIINGYPFLVNDEQITNAARGFAKEFLGTDKVSELGLRMTGEDFSFYAQRYPATFYRLGVGFENRTASSLHSSTFEVNEEALPVGAGLMAWIALSFML